MSIVKGVKVEIAHNTRYGMGEAYHEKTLCMSKMP